MPKTKDEIIADFNQLSEEDKTAFKSEIYKRPDEGFDGGYRRHTEAWQKIAERAAPTESELDAMVDAMRV